jgi:hypothetical protein
MYENTLTVPKVLFRREHLLVYYESIKRELKTKPTFDCRYDERLKTKVEESTHLTYTGLIGELQHLKIKTRLIDEMFASVMGEYVFLGSVWDIEIPIASELVHSVACVFICNLLKKGESRGQTMSR